MPGPEPPDKSARELTDTRHPVKDPPRTGRPCGRVCLGLR